MKWIVRLSAVLVVVVAAIVLYAVATARSAENPVGFEAVQAAAPDGRPMALGIWYPTSGSPRPTTLLGATLLKVAPAGPVLGSALPLVVISHGNGGGVASHVDLAMALASAGYVVAAPMHPGDNFADQSAAGSPTLFSDRARQLRASIDYMLDHWQGHDHIDATRVGAFGLSAGGFAVLTLIGGKPDMASIATHCAAHPEFVCAVLRHSGSGLLKVPVGDVGEFAADPRIKAAVVAAPGLGFTFASDGLAGVGVPVQLWSGELDQTVPYASNAGIVRAGLGAHVEYHEAKGAAHLSFLSPCGLLKPPAVCTDAPGFDREKFHAAMNADVIRFFNAHW
jgi:predicted dienelactone hydrolase